MPSNEYNWYNQSHRYNFFGGFKMIYECPDGRRLYGFVKVGPKGQVVIPKEARDKHGIKPGDQLAIGGDDMGIAIFTSEQLNDFFRNIMGGEAEK